MPCFFNEWDRWRPTYLLSYGAYKVTIDLSQSTDWTFLFLSVQHLKQSKRKIRRRSQWVRLLWSHFLLHVSVIREWQRRGSMNCNSTFKFMRSSLTWSIEFWNSLTFPGEKLTFSGARVWFVNHEDDYWPIWTTMTCYQLITITISNKNKFICR